MTKIITQPGTGKQFKMGRNKRRAMGLHLMASNYLSLPDIKFPDSIDYTKLAGPVLAQLLGNDDLSDCTAATALHIAGVLIDNAGGSVTWTEKQWVDFYAASTGYVPGDPATDNGGNEVDVLNYWMRHGLLANGSHKIAGYLKVDATNVDEMKAILFLLENLYFGVMLPSAWITPMPEASGFTWGVAGKANADNGHAFPGLGYDANQVIINTWGMNGGTTWEAVEKYAGVSADGELWAVISQDCINEATAKAPNGFDWEQLKADYKKFGGRNIVV